MANNSTRISGMQQKTIPDPTDMVVAYSSVSNADVIIPISNLYSNTGITTKYVNTVILSITGNSTPANSSANVVQNSFWSDGNYLYYAVSNNQIKRIPLTTF